MKKADYIKKIANKVGLSINDMKIVYGAMDEVIRESLAAGETVPIAQGIKAERYFRDPRKFYNPQTGEFEESKGKYCYKCKISKNFTEAVNDII